MNVFLINLWTTERREDVTLNNSLDYVYNFDLQTAVVFIPVSAVSVFRPLTIWVSVCMRYAIVFEIRLSGS